MIPPPVGLIACALPLCLACCLWAEDARYSAGKSIARIADERLVEASGLVASRRYPNTFWTHNDSGDSPRLFAVQTDGQTRASYRVRDANAIDWEDIALAPATDSEQDDLYVADIGDNRGIRAFVTVYCFAEPNLASAVSDTEACRAIDLVYPDGPCDAETLMVDPHTQDMYIVSKRNAMSRLYRAKAPFKAGQRVTLQFVGSLPWGLATGGDIAPNGRYVVIRNPNFATLWPIAPERSLAESLLTPGLTLHLQQEPQGESICFGPDGLQVYTLSEGISPNLFRYTPLASPPSSD